MKQYTQDCSDLVRASLMCRMALLKDAPVHMECLPVLGMTEQVWQIFSSIPANSCNEVELVCYPVSVSIVLLTFGSFVQVFQPGLAASCRPCPPQISDNAFVGPTHSCFSLHQTIKIVCCRRPIAVS